MAVEDFPAPAEGFVLTHFLVVSDQDRSREFYRSLFGGRVVRERDPVVLKVANSWLILNVGGGPTDDKPGITLATPRGSNETSAFLNVRVADIHTLRSQSGRPRGPRSSRSRRITEPRSVPTSRTPTAI